VRHALWPGIWAAGPVFGDDSEPQEEAAGGGNGSARDGFGPLLTSFEAALPDIRREFERLLLPPAEASATVASLEGATDCPNGSSASEARVCPAAPVAEPLSPQAGFVPEEAGLHHGRRWRVWPVAVGGRLDPRRCAAVPATCALLAATPLAQVVDGQAKFSVMRPGAVVKPHAGPVDTRLRMHCTLALAAGAVAELRVGQRWLRWRPGRCFLFDESYEHEVRVVPAGRPLLPASGDGSSGNGSVIGDPPTDAAALQSFRSVLLVDVANPFLEPLAQFKAAVTADGWDRFEPQLVEAWHAVRREGSGSASGVGPESTTGTAARQ